MSVHQGHRERMKQRFLKEGLDGFADHEVLELLLFYAIPQRDTNDLAHRLIDRFGSLDAVLDAPREELLSVKGVGENTATLLTLATWIYRRYLISAQREPVRVDSTDKAKALLWPRFVGEKDEVVYMLCMDS